MTNQDTMPAPDAIDPERPCFLRTNEVCRRVGYSQRHIYRLVKANQFPKPLKLGYRTLAWTDAAILEWQRDRMIAELVG